MMFAKLALQYLALTGITRAKPISQRTYGVDVGSDADSLNITVYASPCPKTWHFGPPGTETRISPDGCGNGRSSSGVSLLQCPLG